MEPKKFYKKTMQEKHDTLRAHASLTEDELQGYVNFGHLGERRTSSFIENSIGVMEVPLGVALNFMVNGKETIVPMAVEESSVVAAASHAAKLAKPSGGFFASTTGSIMFSQIQIVNCEDVYGAKLKILEHKKELIETARKKDPILASLGGGPKDLEVRVIDHQDGPMLVVHLQVDTKDAMGANTVNTMAESIAPTLEQITNGKVYLRIISNLADQRLARSRCKIRKSDIGQAAVDGIINAYRFAKADPYRAATHNKGIMNGISAVVLATGNDTRAVEAGAHAYAAISGHYSPLTTWEKDREGDLIGTIELPLAVGTVGGTISLHPKAQTNLKIMKVKTSKELAEIMASVGLAQNFAALRALATEGIQAGHMKLHARNIAMMAGADISQIDEVVSIMVKEGNIRLDRAKEILNQPTI
ncbi:3-hydroxy-3-methylglutaryl-coenzyme A reductase [Cytobacillus oceanisediminis]|uniref:3-hydroxy-3-methylglutaryl coenzyme A reductase n=1 Tax=Cytobacillus oceanisediminis TaxID=665099 RepID=A0A2V3A5R5_9BACI|nr:hydroxymethylglutaryl-CoA reductase, degradative [Cytobacillus oceanisediminis]PWW32353.1 3-hydroxy-3-methylglutaryl-coenzyme A reductase [Cytobacillus oceanisediminis]